MTATAINAMSMQPPSMIVCVNRAAAFHAAISEATSFAINILHRNHVDISMGCGGKARGEERFEYGAWGEECGVPILTDAQARIVCVREAKFDYGSHSVFIGRVVSIGMHGEIDPLIYVDGRYTCLPAGQAVASQSQSEIEMSRQLAV
jgi:flavin reductase (DIM6/NTAB) family NADH-FMN oxidoreductase RutF